VCARTPDAAAILLAVTEGVTLAERWHSSDRRARGWVAARRMSSSLRLAFNSSIRFASR